MFYANTKRMPFDSTRILYGLKYLRVPRVACTFKSSRVTYIENGCVSIIAVAHVDYRFTVREKESYDRF